MRWPVAAYALSLLVLAAAVLLRWLLDPLLGDRLPLVSLFGAVAAAVWVGGYRPALLVTILGYLACHYLFIEPRGTLTFNAGLAVGGLVYLFTCALIIGIGEAMRGAQARASARGELLRVTLGSIGDAVITTDTEGRVTYLNRVAESLTGWTQDEALGHPLDEVFRIINDDTRKTVESPTARALREGVVTGLANHTLLVAKDGSERPIDDSAAPIRDEREVVSGSVLIFRDVSERRLWEKREAARLLNARILASIVESSDDAIISKTLDGIIQTWNAAAERLFGHTSEEAVGRHISLVIPPDRIAEEDHIIATLKAGTRVDHVETERVRKNGQRIFVSLTVSPIRDDAGTVIGASKIVRDITERRLAESERQKLVTLVESSADFIAICDMDGVPIFVNRAGLQMIGLDSLEQARTVHVLDFFFPEDRGRVNELFGEVLDKGHAEIDVRFRHFKTGHALWMAYKILRLDDARGRPVAIATVSQDVTERRRMEDSLRGLAADLAEADRRKDEFLATLAHELRNPLAPLSNTLEILKRSSGPDASVRQGLETMERQLEQLVRLVDDLLDLSRITHNRIELRKRHVDLAAVLRQAVLAAQPLADAARHTIEVNVPSEPIYLHADPVRLTQVFDNLLNNSCKYTPPGGTIRVTVQRDGQSAVATVTDTGIGIPHDKLASIFDMFAQVDRTLEQSQGGLGIGLTLVKRLVEMHGGLVEAQSAGEGQGSAFVVRLPVAPGVAAQAGQAAASETQTSSARHRILVVDDNEDSADSLALLLQLTGHQVFTAHDGPDALDAAEQHRPDVVLLDIGLPVLNGYDVCRRIREQPWGQTMVLVALTGWGQDEDRRRSQDAGFDDHLVKPVDHTRLLALLSTLTEPRATS